MDFQREKMDNPIGKLEKFVKLAKIESKSKRM